VALPLATSELRYYIRPDAGKVSIFQPDSGSVAASGRGTARIRQVLDEGRRGAVVEGTFQPSEPVEVDARDLVWLRATIGAGPIDLYGRLEEDRALAQGELRLRTIGLTLEEDRLAALREAAGIPLRNVMFEVLPQLGAPHDLYALAVLAVKTLLVDKENTLPVALDELSSLAREAAAEGAGEDLAARVGRVFGRDARWTQSLAPHRLVHADLSPEEACSGLPASLWHRVLAALVRMLPGSGPDSSCPELRVSSGTPASVFEPALADLDELLHVTRGLVVSDWTLNQDVRKAISKLRGS
jgi:hypothetical protein